MAKVRKSHPRFRREGEPPRIEITNDDVEIVRRVREFRFIGSDDLFRLFAHRSSDKLSRRLTRLWRAGFLDRPNSQIEYHRRGGGSDAYTYGLGNAGARLLKERLDERIDTGDWQARNRRYTRESLDHTLSVTRFLVDFEVACRKRGDVEYVSFAEIMKSAPEDTRQLPIPGRWRVPLSWQGAQGTVAIEPDGIFGFRLTTPEGKQKVGYIFLEIDRGTMTIVPNERTRESDAFLHRTSVLRKFVCYADSHRQKLHQTHLGIPSARVLTLTTSAGRAEVMRDASHEHVVQPMHLPPGLFLFGDSQVTDPFAHRFQMASGKVISLITT